MDRKSAIFIGMGVECVAVILVMIYLGRYLDVNYGWGGLGAALGAVMGLVGWVVHLLLVVRILAKKDKAEHTNSQ